MPSKPVACGLRHNLALHPWKHFAMYSTHTPRTLMFVGVAVLGGCMAAYAVYATPGRGVSGAITKAACGPRRTAGLRETWMAQQIRTRGLQKAAGGGGKARMGGKWPRCATLAARQEDRHDRRRDQC